MDPVNLLILLVTFLAVTVICWGLVVIYCCISQYYPCSSSSSSNSSIEQNLYQMDSYAVIKAKNPPLAPVPLPQLEYLSPVSLMTNYLSPNQMNQSMIPYGHRPSYPSLVSYPAGPVCTLGGVRNGLRRHTSLRTLSYPSYFPHHQAIAIPPPIPPPNPYVARRSFSRAASVIPSNRIIAVQPIYSCPTANSNIPVKSNITSASVTGAPPLPPMSKHPTIRKSRRLTHPLSDLAYI